MNHRWRDRVDWDTYLARFHADKAGITEGVLARCTFEGMSPYAWLLEGIALDDRILDLACGSAPTHHGRESLWIGLDRSASELERAQGSGANRVVLADAHRLPFDHNSFDTVVCAMALMLFVPLETVLREIARVVPPGGNIHALVPTTRPLTWTDRMRVARLSTTLRTTPRFPASPLKRGANRAFSENGFLITSDTRRRYRYPINNQVDLHRLIHSLYLPGVEQSRLDAALDGTAHGGRQDLGIPLRRITAVRRDKLLEPREERETDRSDISRQ